MGSLHCVALFCQVGMASKRVVAILWLFLKLPNAVEFTGLMLFTALLLCQLP